MKTYMIEYIAINGNIESKCIQAKSKESALDRFRNTVSHEEILSIETY